MLLLSRSIGCFLFNSCLYFYFITMNYEVPAELLHWADGIDCAVTICDNEGKILYMNDRSRLTFARHGDIIGHDLFGYHPEKAQAQIRHMLATGETNAYYVTKNGVKKLIYQTPWRREGEIAGLVEISIPRPADMPHYDRDKQ